MYSLDSNSKMLPASWVLWPSEPLSAEGSFWEAGAFQVSSGTKALWPGSRAGQPAKVQALNSDKSDLILSLADCVTVGK